MSASDAILVGGDWISEHYLTTDATSQSFKAEVLNRRKEWDAAEGETVRSRFTGARAELLARLAGLEEAPGLVGDVRRDLQQVLGYDAIGLTHETTGPLTLVTQHTLPDVAGLALVAATHVDSAEDLLDKEAATLAETWEPEDGDPVKSVARLLSAVFIDEDGPAFALVLAGRVLLVAEKERWAEGRYLALDLQLVCERNDTTRAGEVDRALACVSAESLAPDAEGNVWWNRVLEESVKHTVGVSQDLREGVRLSIELIANEVVTRRRERGLEPLPPDEAQPLAKQALRYLYRILFLLYAESSPELGVLPVGATEYDQGYSLDRLRELVQVSLTTPRLETGTHFYDSLGVLFRLVDQGYQPDTEHEDGLVDPLQFRSLRADLFHPDAVMHIDEVGLGNARLQQVLQHLLLSKESRGSDRGFISYAELGINQLGAVYEGLMSYTGRFAENDLYEVAKNGDSSKGSWLVPVERAGGIDGKDFVRVEDSITGEFKPVLHREGAFVFRLAGRERQQSASYYTPEVLTRFTVGQALEELLDQDERRTTAEEILGLTVCEPALGSGAFAIEAVRQLAAEYLKRRQDEIGERIDPEAYSRELQRVKAYLALHNVYGVDLNATAVELAEISLWLDTMVEGLHAPWFGLHLRRGNSLIGARKAVFTRQEVADRSWLKSVPRKVVSGTTSPDEASSITGRIPHFLLPADGWGAAADVGKEIKDLVPEAVQRLKTWRRSMTAKPAKKQIDRLVEMGERVERLWAIASKRLELANAQTRREITLWGRSPVEMRGALATRLETPDAERHVTREEIEASLADLDGAYRRLRLVMDAWCALWFWPLTEDPEDGGVAPPTLEQWFDALAAILGGTGSAKANRQGDETFADITTWDDLGAAEELDRDFAGASRVERVVGDHPWLRVCQRVSAQQGFFHWELDFAQVFDEGGFDLQVGNPPWVRPDWDEAATFAELEPALALADALPRAEWDRRAAAVLESPDARQYYVDAASPVAANREFLTSSVLRPVLAGLRPDLYRCFIDHSWNAMSPDGVVGLIHLESHFTDQAAGLLRSHVYQRLRRHWEFANELHLFEIQNQKHYGVNIYGNLKADPGFMSAVSLYHPDTLKRSLRHDGEGEEPGLKDADGAWDVRPHARRIVRVNRETISSWHKVLEGPHVPRLESRMVFAVNESVANVVAKLATAPRMGDQDLLFSGGWVEGSDNRKGLFDVRWWTPGEWQDVILQGPHLQVALPFSKVPNESMKSQRDWAQVDLEALGARAIPTCAFEPGVDRSRYDSSYTHWGEIGPARGTFRVAWRSMADNVGMRTLFPALIPPGAAHVHGINSLAVRPEASSFRLAVIAGALSSLVTDFSVRVAPKSAISPKTIERLPFVAREVWPMLALRSLRLNCLTEAYAPMWEESWDEGLLLDGWVGGIEYDARSRLDAVARLWNPEVPLRRDSDRRQALVEVDALVALGAGLDADELCSIYRTHFPVLHGYDRNTYFYDANGRLVPNSVLTFWRKKKDGINVEERTATNPSGNTYTYELPFVTLDREADMRQAYAHFEKVLAERGSA